MPDSQAPATCQPCALKSLDRNGLAEMPGPTPCQPKRVQAQPATAKPLRMRTPRLRFAFAWSSPLPEALLRNMCGRVVTTGLSPTDLRHATSWRTQQDEDATRCFQRRRNQDAGYVTLGVFIHAGGGTAVCTRRARITASTPKPRGDKTKRVPASAQLRKQAEQKRTGFFYRCLLGFLLWEPKIPTSAHSQPQYSRATRTPPTHARAQAHKLWAQRNRPPASRRYLAFFGPVGKRVRY